MNREAIDVKATGNATVTVYYTVHHYLIDSKAMKLIWLYIRKRFRIDK